MNMYNLVRAVSHRISCVVDPFYHDKKWSTSIVLLGSNGVSCPDRGDTIFFLSPHPRGRCMNLVRAKRSVQRADDSPPIDTIYSGRRHPFKKYIYMPKLHLDEFFVGGNRPKQLRRANEMSVIMWKSCLKFDRHSPPRSRRRYLLPSRFPRNGNINVPGNGF